VGVVFGVSFNSQPPPGFRAPRRLSSLFRARPPFVGLRWLFRFFDPRSTPPRVALSRNPRDRGQQAPNFARGPRKLTWAPNSIT